MNLFIFSLKPCEGVIPQGKFVGVFYTVSGKERQVTGDIHV